MKKENVTENLNREIALLEARRKEELKDLKEQFHLTYESLKPVNILKDTIKTVTESQEIRKSLSSASIGMASGYLVDKMLFRSSKNPLVKLVGVVVQTITTNLAAKNSGRIQESGKKILHTILSKLVQKNRFSERDF
jgi:hypothetical protein